MTAEIGNSLLFISMLIMAWQAFPVYKRLRSADAIVFGCMLVCFFCLIHAFATSDYSILSVFKYSHESKPMLYKITGTWGNHEGSILLLIVILCGYNLALALNTTLERPVKFTAMRIQAIITSCFMAFCLYTSNPFTRLSPAPKTGIGLNPLLQDIGLALHPPILYIGYIGFSITLSIALAGLLRNGVTKNWAAQLQPWTTFSWTFLTLGIGIGSWWAYRELGWGGFWFWDPVENMSLLPWVTATALIHCLHVVKTQNHLKAWTICLSILTFAFSLLGIFLVRSGILTSVHAFTHDPARGLFILIFLTVFIGSAFIIFALKRNTIAPNKKATIPLMSRETFILYNNLLLLVIAVTIVLGTLYPLVLKILTGSTITVGAPFYNKTLGWVILLVLALAVIGPLLNWKHTSYKQLVKNTQLPALVAVTITFIMLMVIPMPSIGLLLMFTSSLLIITSARSLHKKINPTKYTVKHVMQKIKKINTGVIAMTVSHIGLGILAIGIICSEYGTIEKEIILKIGENEQLGKYNFTLKDIWIFQEKNYMVSQAQIDLFKGKKQLATLYPENRFYIVEKQNTIEADIFNIGLSNIFTAMGETNLSGGTAIRIYHKPFINLIWIGSVIMVIGGLISCSRRRKTP